MADSIEVWLGYSSVGDFTTVAPFAIDVEQSLASVSMTDGVGSTDDSVILQLVGPVRWTHSPFNNRDSSTVSAIKAASTVMVGINGRLFGPYDITSVETDGETAEDVDITVLGKVDKQFEETVLLKPLSKESDRPPWDTVLARQPFKTWDAELGGGLPEIVFGDQAASNALSSIRGAMEEWFLTCHPRAGAARMTVPPAESRLGFGYNSPPSNQYMVFDREVEYTTEFPESLSTAMEHRGYAGDGKGGISGVSRGFVTVTQDITLDDVVADISTSTPDIDNKKGDYKDRSILITARSVAAGTHVLFQAGTRRPHIYLESDALSNTRLIQVLMDRERWRLQNEAVTASVTVLGDVRLLPKQVVTLPEEAIEGGGQWRVVTATHQYDPGGDGYTTALELAKWQGLWRLRDRQLHGSAR